jgi:2-desacetyl-2-hydroxyethyl bacteriochlorophyllide A dehydrogenase
MSSSSMHALVWEAPRQMNLREASLPEVQPDEVLVKVSYVGICGSELSGYLGHNALRVPPLVMGHEFSGEITALGERAQAIQPGLAAGQLVTANPMVYCGKCEYCTSGQTHLCPNRRLIGAHRPGAFAGYTTVPAWMVVPLGNVPLRDGALAEPVACAMRIRDQVGDINGQTVLITGAGAIGILALQALRLFGAAQVFISDTDPDRLSAVAALGGEPLNPKTQDVVKAVRDATGGRGAAAAVDAVGKAVTREQCVKATRSGGTVILSGLHEESSVVPVAEVIRREIRLQGAFCYTMADFREAVDLLAQGKVRLDPWIIEAPLEEGGAWFERLSSEQPGKTAKVLLRP